MGRFLRHFKRVRGAAPAILSKYGVPVAAQTVKARSYLIRSGNTFPPSTWHRFERLQLRRADAGDGDDARERSSGLRPRLEFGDRPAQRFGEPVATGIGQFLPLV